MPSFFQSMLTWEAVYLTCFAGSILFATIAGFLTPPTREPREAHDPASSDESSAPKPFRPWNPIVIFSTLATFGMIGYLCRLLFSWNGWICLAVAAPISLLVGAGVFFLFEALIRSRSEGVGIDLAHLVDRTARTASAIPARGVGEILLSENGDGGRRLPARSATGASIERDCEVRIERIVDEVLLVKPALAKKIKIESESDSDPEQESIS